MVAAEPQPTFAAGGAPLSVLLDFDGTISRQDVGDELLARHAPDPAEVERKDRLYDEGTIGSRDLMRWDMEVLPRDREMLLGDIETIELDETVVGLVELVRSVGGVVEIVSDGIGVHVEPMLERVGLADLPVATNRAVLGQGGDAVTFPYGHPACHVCGTCKRERIFLHRAARRAVVFVGDGTSDRYAANHADVVFAKDALAIWCAEMGMEVEAWALLSDVSDWLADAMATGRLPAAPDAFDDWATRHQRDSTFICGPEVGRSSRLGDVRP